MLRGGLLLGFGNISLALLGLVRNAFIARMISVQDFGIGSSFIITLIVLKALSDLGLYRLIIQAPDGDEPRVMSTLHAVHACRGLIGAVTLFLAGGTVARYFGVPEATWAYRSLGILVLLEGCVHFDIYRLQRKLIFLPGVAADGGGLLISIVAVAPFVAIFHDYRAVLFIVITHQFSFVVMSHLFARRPYRFAWDREIVRRVFSFGGPLLIASLLIIITSNANRVIVGGMIGLTVLAWFGMATSLTMMASDFANKSLTSFFMPLLSNAQNEPATFRKLHVLTMQSGMLIGIGSTIGVALFGPLLVNILYGQRYADALTVIVWLAVMYGLRSAAGAASTIAISGANTKDSAGRQRHAPAHRAGDVDRCGERVRRAGGGRALDTWRSFVSRRVGAALAALAGPAACRIEPYGAAKLCNAYSDSHDIFVPPVGHGVPRLPCCSIPVTRRCDCVSGSEHGAAQAVRVVHGPGYQLIQKRAPRGEISSLGWIDLRNEGGYGWLSWKGLHGGRPAGARSSPRVEVPEQPVRAVHRA